MKNKLKIYVASSWRNKYQPDVVALLLHQGYEVYDFRKPAEDDDGFRWSEIDPDWKNWTVEKYAAALEHPIAKRGFDFDYNALRSADLCVLVLPSGRSASWEYGHHSGFAGRSGIVHMPEPCEPELMYRGSIFTSTDEQLVTAVEDYIKRHSLPHNT
jgi:hypothetical protein